MLVGRNSFVNYYCCKQCDKIWNDLDILISDVIIEVCSICGERIERYKDWDVYGIKDPSEWNWKVEMKQLAQKLKKNLSTSVYMQTGLLFGLLRYIEYLESQLSPHS